MDAWFTFLSSDAPKDILRLIEAYPEFKEYYHDIALFRKNSKELMNMYSEALIQMDRNTANYMIEEMQKEVEELNARLEEWKDEVAEKGEKLIVTQQALSEKNEALVSAQQELSNKNEALALKDAYIKELEAKLGLNT